MCIRDSRRDSGGDRDNEIAGGPDGGVGVGEGSTTDGSELRRAGAARDRAGRRRTLDSNGGGNGGTTWDRSVVGPSECSR